MNNIDPRMVAVCGFKKAGKTTVIRGIIQSLAARGLKVAVIKRDAHEFECDVPGTDSYSYAEAGAYATSVYSRTHMFVHRIGTEETDFEIVNYFPEADVILLEGGRSGEYNKVEVLRRGQEDTLGSNPNNRFAIVSDLSREEIQGIGDEPILGFDEIDKLADMILTVVGREAQNA